MAGRCERLRLYLYLYLYLLWRLLCWGRFYLDRFSLRRSERAASVAWERVDSLWATSEEFAGAAWRAAS